MKIYVQMEGNKMEIQFVLYGLFIIGIIVSVWMITTTSRRVYKQRLDVISEKINSIGGKNIIIDEIDRSDCPMCDEYKDRELSYKFYKFSYKLENDIKEGYAIFSMKQNKFGPNGGINGEWMWHF